MSCFQYIDAPCDDRGAQVATTGLMRGNGTKTAPINIDFERLNKAEAERLVEMICCSAEALTMLKKCLQVPEHGCGIMSAIPGAHTVPSGSTYFAIDCDTLFMSVDRCNSVGSFWLDLSNVGSSAPEIARHSSGALSGIPAANTTPIGSSYFATDCDTLFVLTQAGAFGEATWIDQTNAG